LAPDRASAQEPDAFRFVVEVLRRRVVDLAPAEDFDGVERLEVVDFDPSAFDALDFAFVVLAFELLDFVVLAFDEAAGFGLRDFAALDVDESERLRFALSFPIGSALPTAFTASPAAPPTVPAILPAVRPTDLTTFPGSGIDCPPSLGPMRDDQAVPCRGRAAPLARSMQEPSSSQPNRPTRYPVNLSFRSILLLVAVVIFVLAAFGVSLGTVGLVPLGLAFFAGAFLLGEGGFPLRR
jgi:hypothetical protein